MEIVLIILAFIFLLTGFLGSVVPILPGPPISFLGLLLLQWSGRAGYDFSFLVILGVITAVIMVMDNILPAILTKKFGGSRMAVFGSIAGVVIGMFFLPAGIIIGPFLGAFAGEIFYNRFFKTNQFIVNEDGSKEFIIAADSEKSAGIKALTAAFGAFLAFIAGTGVKLILCSFMIFFAVRALIT